MTIKHHIEIRSVTHHYRDRHAAVLADVSCDVPKGQALAVIGQSGCGKSTLLHVIAGLLHPTSGAVWIDGAQVTGPSPRHAMMFQQPLLYPWMTVTQNAALGPRFAGTATAQKGRVQNILERIGLGDLADANVQTLSGGQQQRVALARSLATEPDVLLLDEPFSALDTFTRRDLQHLVRDMAKSMGLTLILVTHDIDEAVTMADRALVMAPNPGRIVGDFTFASGRARDPADPQIQFERARLLTVLGETADTLQPGAYYAI